MLFFSAKRSEVFGLFLNQFQFQLFEMIFSLLLLSSLSSGPIGFNDGRRMIELALLLSSKMYVLLCDKTVALIVVSLLFLVCFSFIVTFYRGIAACLCGECLFTRCALIGSGNNNNNNETINNNSNNILFFLDRSIWLFCFNVIIVLLKLNFQKPTKTVSKTT